MEPLNFELHHLEQQRAHEDECVIAIDKELELTIIQRGIHLRRLRVIDEQMRSLLQPEINTRLELDWVKHDGDVA